MFADVRAVTNLVQLGGGHFAGLMVFTAQHAQQRPDLLDLSQVYPVRAGANGKPAGIVAFCFK